MKKRGPGRLVPLMLIALLLPVLVFSVSKVWTILRQSDREQDTFRRLAAQVARDGGTSAPVIGTPTATDGLRQNHAAQSASASHSPESSAGEQATASAPQATAEGAAETETTAAPEVESLPEAGLPVSVPQALLGPDAQLDPDDLLEYGALLDAPPREVLPQYATLHAQNPHFFGWVKIDDTPIDYPVMFSPEDPEHYLHRDFFGEYAYSGTPFLEGSCDPDGTYYIVYAHHMKDGTMFSSLIRYRDREYWEAHPVIRFDTLYEQREYRIVAAFMSRVYRAEERGVFRYYEYTNLTAPEQFEAYVKGVSDSALYSTGEAMAYGDELLALSTCNYHTADGRFVVVAKRIVETETADSKE